MPADIFTCALDGTNTNDDVLARIYVTARTLRSVLGARGHTQHAVGEGGLLDTVLVCEVVGGALEHPFVDSPPGLSSVRSAVDAAISWCLTKGAVDAFGRPQNLLARGFQQRAGGIQPWTDNPQADFFRRAGWAKVAKEHDRTIDDTPGAGGAVGAVVLKQCFAAWLFQSLTNPNIAWFLALRGGNRWQLAGLPADAAALAARQFSREAPPTAPATTSHAVSKEPALFRTPWKTRPTLTVTSSDISMDWALPRSGRGSIARLKDLPRSRLVVCRETLFHVQSFSKTPGMPARHVLREILRDCCKNVRGGEIRTVTALVSVAEPPLGKPKGSIVPANAARRLARHIFCDAPHCTDLASFNGGSLPADGPSGTSRNRSIPKALLKVVPLLQLFLDRFAACDIGAILAKHCPLQTVSGAASDSKPALLERPLALCTTHSDVMNFVRECIFRVVPSGLVGCSRFRRFFLSIVQSWVIGGAKDEYTVRLVAAGLHSGCIEALGVCTCDHTEADDNHGRATFSGDEKRRLLQWTLWLLLCFVSPLLSQHFYLTTSESTGMSTLYFRKPTWSIILRQTVSQLVQRLQLEAVTAKITAGAGATRSADLAHIASVRVTPKATGMRPIMNLSKVVTESRLCKFRQLRTLLGSAANTKLSSICVRRQSSLWSDAPGYSLVGIKRSLSTMSSACLTATGASQSQSHAAALSAPVPSPQHVSQPVRFADQSRSMNSLLRPVLQVLQHEQGQHTRLLGSSVYGLAGVHRALRRWSEHHTRPDEESSEPQSMAAAYFVPVMSGIEPSFESSYSHAAAVVERHDLVPPMFAVACDVSYAFDSIRQSLIAEVAEQLLPHGTESYVISRYAQVSAINRPTSTFATAPARCSAAGHRNAAAAADLKVRWRANVCRGDGSDGGGGASGVSFADVVAALALRHRNSIFVDGVSRVIKTRAAVVSQLRNHLMHQMVLLPGGQLFSQRTGIPQGSVLSALLCNLYLGHLERHALVPQLAECLNEQLVLAGPEALAGLFGSGNEHSCTMAAAPLLRAAAAAPLVMRGMDDWLCLTSSRLFATAFLAAIAKGFAQYGCFTSPRKTIHNVPVPGVAVSTTDCKPIPWFGLAVHCHEGSVQPDHARVSGRGALSAAVSLGSSVVLPVDRMADTFQSFLRPRCHGLLLDLALLQLPTVAINVLSLLQVSCAKLLVLLHYSLAVEARACRAGGQPSRCAGTQWVRSAAALASALRLCAAHAVDAVRLSVRRANGACAVHAVSVSSAPDAARRAAMAAPVLATPVAAVAGAAAAGGPGVSAGTARPDEPAPSLPLPPPPRQQQRAGVPAAALRVLFGAHDHADLLLVGGRFVPLTSTPPVAASAPLRGSDGLPRAKRSRIESIPREDWAVGEAHAQHDAAASAAAGAEGTGAAAPPSRGASGCTCMAPPLRACEVRWLYYQALASLLPAAHVHLQGLRPLLAAWAAAELRGPRRDAKGDACSGDACSGGGVPVGCRAPSGQPLPEDAGVRPEVIRAASGALARRPSLAEQLDLRPRRAWG